VVSIAEKFNLRVRGRADGQPMLFAHGFGCDQNMWRHMTPAFEDDFQVIVFDFVGAGKSDLSAYDPERYSSLSAYAADVLEICRELDLCDVIFVGHSVSAMIGVLAAANAPDRFAALVLVGPSPRYIDDGQYVGGFTEDDIAGLLSSLESNYLGWSSEMAPVIMGNQGRPQLGAKLTASFCRTDPEIQKRFARVTFLSDNREDLAWVQVPALVLQCSEDVIAPDAVGQFVHQQIPGSRLVKLRATGHGPNLSAPQETIDAITAFVHYHPDRFCTAVFAVLDPTAERIRLTAASGGHHLPVRLDAGGEFTTVGENGTLLGMLDTPSLTDATTMLVEGDVVVLYTDGVLEARRNGEFFGEERLRAVIARAAAVDAQRIADCIVDAALEFQHGDARDDIAVVVIKVPTTARTER
jgi:sigma-B regulation protein RsbQ